MECTIRMHNEKKRIDLYDAFVQGAYIKKFFIIMGMILLPSFAHAEGDNVTRRDAFLLMWESISRPAYEKNTSYDDLGEDENGFLEISYAKNRGILPDEDIFRPNEPLLLKDALLWLYRTRNVRELPDMSEEDLSSMISDYPIVEMDREMEGRVSRADLEDLIQTLDATLTAQVHEVSFYGADFHGRGTAFGETFNMYETTAAHRSFPYDTLVKVTNVDNKESVIVRINDRGPYVHGRDMDLSRAAFEKIAHAGQGVLNATFQRLGDAELIDACAQKQRVYQKRITRDTRFYRGIPHNFTIGDPLVLQSNKPFVIRFILFPDGQKLRIQDFVNPTEKYQFSPDMPGRYSFFVGDAFGRVREMRMNVSACVLPE